MSDFKLDAKALAEAQLTLETIFGSAYVQGLEERSALIASMPENTYKQEIIRCEKANEGNYNNLLPSVRALRENFMRVEEVAKILNTRDVEVTKDLGIENNVEVMETSGVVRM